MIGDSAKYRDAAMRCRLNAKLSGNWVEWLALASSWDQIAEQDESLSSSAFEFDFAAMGANSLAAPRPERRRAEY
jgi:hypothetical protein